MTKASGSIDLKSLKVAGKEVNKYITTINNGGIKVHDIDKQNIDYAQIDSNGLTVYQNTGKIAEFGSSIHLGLNEAQVIIGNENGTHQTSHITIDNGGINIYRESDLVMHLGEHTTIGRENKSQLAIENGFLQFSSYVSNSRISQFEIGDVNTKRTTYTPLLTQEIEIGSSYFIEKEDPRTGMEALYEIFCDPEDYDYLDPEPGNPYIHPVNTTINAIDYYYADPIWDSEDAYDWPDNEPVLFASVLKIELGNLGEDFNENDTDLYLGFNGDTIADNYYNNASGMISLRPIRWCLKTERISGEDITFLILPLNFVVLNSSSYRWNPGDTQLTRPNGRFTNMSVMLYKCNNPNNSFSSFKPYLTFGNRTVTENGNNYTVGDYSVTFGKNLINTVDNCFVIGKNNIEPNLGDLFVIGTGSDTSNRANSFKIDGSGYLNVVDGFQIKVNNNQLMTLGTTGIRIGSINGAHTVIDGSGQRIYTGDGTLQIANLGYGEGNIEDGTGVTNTPYYLLGSPPNTSSVSDYNATTEYSQGSWVKYNGKIYIYINQTASTGIPPTNTNYWIYIIGNYSLAQGWHTTAAGFGSVAEGSNNIACGSSAHAEGYACRAFGEHSHAEGYYARSIGKQSHAEGSFSRAYGYAAHAEGHNNNAIGDESHVTGEWNDAGYEDQFVCGKYNENNSNDLFEVGNGTGINARSNAFRITSAGAAVLQKGITAGGSITCAGLISSSTVRPSTNGGAALGSSSYKWGNIWTSSTLYKDEAPVSTATAYDCIWDKTSSNNYRLCRPSSSSIRYKKDITTSIKKELDPHNLYKLETKQFRFKEGYFEKDSPYELNPYDVIGFIAEDVEKYYPVACIKIDNEVENWDVRYIVPPMLSLIREQHEEIEKLKEEIKKLENKIN